MNNFREILNNRLKEPETKIFHVDTYLKHFALINYALPKSRLQKYIPSEHFEIPEFDINGNKMAMMSVVPFFDEDFKFPKLFPFLKFGFPQTNFRVYVINKKTNEHVAWFFGTTLGSHVVKIPYIFWRLPWHYARYKFNCKYNDSLKRYDSYNVDFSSKWCNGSVELEDTGKTLEVVEGFKTRDEMMLILTHPVEGFYFRLDKTLGNYSIWHNEMELTFGKAKNAYFSLLEDLGLLSKDEMNNPHSVFLTPNIRFKICLPPKAV
jgi:hypothetical protein